ncbi:MAG TPA: hypothetical protein VF115_13865 [Acidimicrobiia bacterium]
MLDPLQDGALQDLARTIAHTVDVLGRTCTARLLAGIALGLFESPGTDPVLRAASTQRERQRRHRHATPHRGVHRRRPRIRP